MNPLRGKAARFMFAALMLVGAALVLGQTVRAQSPKTPADAGIVDRLQPSVSVQAAAGTDARLPFWFVANEFGRFARRRPAVMTSLAVDVRARPSRRFDIAAGADLVARGADRSALYAHELYVQGIAGPFTATAGRIERIQGMVDTSLTVGGTTLSHNATPIPALRIETPAYVEAPFTNGFLAGRGSFAHGWLESSRFVDRSYLHSKQFYLRVFPERWPVQLHGGLVHNVVWGGTHPELGNLADGPGTFFDVIFVRELDQGETRPGEFEDSGIGNSIAAYDVAVTAQRNGWRGRISRQFYIDTAAGSRFRNLWDGLWGVNLAREETGHWVDRILYEHLRFVRQNALWGAEGRRGARGREVYYNNFTYLSGWTYHGQVLGTPLARTIADAPRLDASPNGFPVVNDIIVANHLGAQGHIAQDWTYTALVTYSRNHGMLFTPQPRLDQLSVLLEATGRVLPAYNLAATAGVAIDTGELYAHRAGLRFGLTWTPR
jgi:hypothetical protein